MKSQGKLSRISVMLSFVIVFLIAEGLAAQEKEDVDKAHAPFTIIVIPDSQSALRDFPEIFAEQTDWIAQRMQRDNINFVVHVGDFTQDNTDEQWEYFVSAMTPLFQTAPVAMAYGNHDVTHAEGGGRNTSQLRRYLPLEDFSKHDWFGGSFDDSMENYYGFFKSSEYKYMFIVLEFGPRDEVLSWANEIVKQYPDRRTIVITHSFTYFDDTRGSEEDSAMPAEEGYVGNNGQEVWEKFASQHENIFLVLSGHAGVAGIRDGAGRMTDDGVAGNNVHQLMSDYSFDDNGGNGWLRLMTFVPNENKVFVRTYSPYLNRFMQDADNEFFLYHIMRSWREVLAGRKY